MMPPSEKGICDMDSICITLKAVHNQLAAQGCWPGVSGQVKSYSVAFELVTPDWDGLSVTAVFTDGTVSKDVLGIKAGEAVPVPHECMATAGRVVSVALYGTDSSGVVLNTGYARLFRTGTGADPADDTSADPTLPVWAQIQGQIGDLDELDTEDKSSLVAAINEAAQSGGGGAGGTTDHSKLKNRDAADQHPIDAITGLETALAEKYSAENPPPGGSDASLGITSATVGQIAKITAVDDSGVPTAWEPVDMPAGDGTDFDLVFEATVSENAASFTQSVDGQGNAFELKELVCIVWTPAYTDTSLTSIGRAVGFTPDARWGSKIFEMESTVAAATNVVGRYEMWHIKAVNSFLCQLGRWESQNVSNAFGVMKPNTAAGNAPLSFETDDAKLFQPKNPQGVATCVKIVGYANNIVPAGTIIRLYGKRV